MKGIRVLGILKLSKSKSGKINGEIIMTRFFSNIEKKVQIKMKSSYIPLVSNKDLSQAILDSLSLSADINQFVKRRDSCLIEDKKPVFCLHTNIGKLSPLVLIEKAGYLYWAILEPNYIEAKGEDDLINMPYVTNVYMLLEQLSDYLGNLAPSTNESSPKMADAIMYLSVTCPFGKPLCCEQELVEVMLSENGNAGRSQPQLSGVTPPWRASIGNKNASGGKSRVDVILNEHIRYSQHDSVAHTTSLEVTGSLSVQAQLFVSTGAPELSLKVNYSATTSSHCHFARILTSPYTSYLETSNAGVILRCVPPLNRTFAAFQYTVLPVKKGTSIEAPVFGFYQLHQEGDMATLRLRIRAANWFANCFVRGAVCEYFRVRLPLPAVCREIQQLHCSCGNASLDGASEKRSLIWTLAAGYPRGASGAEEALTAVLRLQSYDAASEETGMQTAAADFPTFAQVMFRASGISLSGGVVDSKSVMLCDVGRAGGSSTKLKVHVLSELVTSDYRIWNSLGAAPNAFIPSDEMLQCAIDNNTESK